MKSLRGAHILVVGDDPEGVDAFLTKPVDPGRLVKVVEDLIGR